MLIRNILLLDQQRGLDKRRRQAGLNVPLDVAMEEPNARIVRLVPHHHIPARIDLDDIASHRLGGEAALLAGVGTGVFGGAGDDLEVVAVEMHGVAAGVVVVDDDFDDLVGFGDEGVGVGAVDKGVGGGLAGREGGEEGGHFLLEVGYLVEGCAGGTEEVSWGLFGKEEGRKGDEPVGAVDDGEVEVQRDGAVDGSEELLSIVRKEEEVVVFAVGCDGWGSGGEGEFVVVDEVAGDVWFEIGGLVVEHVNVESAEEGEILLGVWLRFDDDAVALCSGDENGVGFLLLSVDAVDFDDRHGVFVEVDVLSGKGGHVDDSDEVFLSRLDVKLDVLSIIHQGTFGDGFSAFAIERLRDVEVDKTRHLVMVPV